MVRSATGPSGPAASNPAGAKLAGVRQAPSLAAGAWQEPHRTQPHGLPSSLSGSFPFRAVRSPLATLKLFMEDLIDGRKKLGEGSFGVVKLFRDRQSGESRAVKYVTLRGADSLAEWEREELALKTLTAAADPGAQHFVRLYRSWVGQTTSNQTGVFVMEACDRSVLQDLLKRAPSAPPLLVALTWACQLMKGLVLLHSLGLVHRDLKPNNVLLQGPGDSAVIKIADLGSARRFGPVLMTAAVQTLPYRAPEILLGAEIIEAGPAT